MKACIFDLDGVIVDTAKYHYIAWKALANKLGFDFTLEDNERLKGVSRMRSLEILLEIGKIELSQKEMEKLAQKKNEQYVKYIVKMTAD
ncbi:MAG: HAD hydrolase-like protein, partial [Bacteroidales bacterium]|nr:HAD hydrolase-like protein [Bacteroidales bacterium]